MNQPNSESRLPADVVRELADSLEAVQELFRSSQQGRVDSTTAVTLLSKDIEHLSRKVSHVLDAIHGTDAGKVGLKDEVSRLSLVLEGLVVSVAELKIQAGRQSDGLKDTNHEIDIVRRDQQSRKSLIDNLWKLVLVLVPGLVALIIQIIKWLTKSEVD